MAGRGKVNILELNARILERFSEAEALLQSVPGGVEKAAVLALNRAITTAQTAASYKARKVYTINPNAFKKGMKLKKARNGNLLAIMSSKNARRELIDFEVSPATVQRGKKSGQLEVAVKRERGLKPIPGAFVERGTKSGRLHILKRTGRGRYPLHVKYGPSPSEMLAGEDVIPYVEKRAKAMLVKRLDHEIDRLLSK